MTSAIQISHKLLYISFIRYIIKNESTLPSRGFSRHNSAYSFGAAIFNRIEKLESLKFPKSIL